MRISVIIGIVVGIAVTLALTIKHWKDDEDDE